MEIEELSLEVPKNYELVEEIGKGSFGEVFLLKDPANEQEKKFVVKVVSYESARRDNSGKITELDVLKKVGIGPGHERIVPFYGYKPCGIDLHLIMGYMKGGSLTNYIKNQPGSKLSEATSKRFTLQILRGVEYLHDNDIIHRDIKGDNVLLEDADNIRITDFGLSKVLQGATNPRSNVGTFCFRAPETFLEEDYDEKADIWSVGCTVIQMTTGRIPFDSLKFNDINKMLLEKKKRPDYDIADCSSDLKGFWGQCFNFDPDKRPDAYDLAKHQFLTN
ncbi:Serine/threonine-protein kinase 26 [Bulinus truncatus]|nr:Serine/threonine-protein kinase 26 [Bulinus truncatus]